MRYKAQIKFQAVQLRKSGCSYFEIIRHLNIAKSTASVWLRDVKLGKSAKEKIKCKHKNGGAKGNTVYRIMCDQRKSKLRNKVFMIMHSIKFEDHFEKVLCALLYWAEGEKGTHRIAFTNSDPEMIKVFLFFFRRSFKIQEDKLYAQLHLHSYHRKTHQVQYWSSITCIPVERISVYQKQQSGRIIRKGYPGCISVRYGDSMIVREMDYIVEYLASMEKKR